MMFPDDTGNGNGLLLQEAARELEAAIHDARVAFDCIGLGETDRAHTSALTARVELEAALTAMQTALELPISQSATTSSVGITKLIADQ